MPEQSFFAFDLAAKMHEAASLPLSGGRATHAIVGFPNLKLFVIYMPSGSTWAEHSTPGRIAVQVLKGRIMMSAGNEQYDLPASHGVAFDTNVKHDVRAIEESWFLLTVVRPTAE
jgi:quercetin dioxygenase-like cupin family protein